MQKRLWLISVALMLLGCGCATAGSIGVIGGADGPTAIYVASSPYRFVWGALLLTVLLLAGVFLWKKFHK